MSTPITITLLQLNSTVGDIEANTQAIIQHMQSHPGTDLFVTPELALIGYPPEDLLFHPQCQTRIDKALILLQKSLSGQGLIVGYPAIENGQRRNRLALIEQDGIQFVYDKKQLPNYATFDEQRYFTAGVKDGILHWRGSRLILLICEDAWHPDELPTNQSLDACIIINASPYTLDKYRQRVSILETASKRLQAPCYYCNMVGGQDELVFDGYSMITNSAGELMSQAHGWQEHTLSNTLPVTKRTPIRQPSPSKDLYQALVTSVKDYVAKNGANGVVIGLSGGIDSAVCACIAVDAFGAENVDCIMMPTQFTSIESLQDARQCALQLGVSYNVIDIEGLYQSFRQVLHQNACPATRAITQQNLQARIRGNILMARSNDTGKLVLCTSNKSELAVGYSTLYGDSVGAFAPLKDVYKTTLYQLCQLNPSLQAGIPARIISKAPSAELAAGQKDEDSLPPYSTLDRILKSLIHHKNNDADLIALGINKKMVDDVALLVQRAEFKRKQSPPGLRISQHGFGRDRRYPITCHFTQQSHEKKRIP